MSSFSQDLLIFPQTQQNTYEKFIVKTEPLIPLPLNTPIEMSLKAVKLTCSTFRVTTSDYIIYNSNKIEITENVLYAEIEDYVEWFNKLSTPQISFNGALCSLTTDHPVTFSRNLQTLFGFDEIVLSSSKASRQPHLNSARFIKIRVIAEERREDTSVMERSNILAILPFYQSHTISQSEVKFYSKYRWPNFLSFEFYDEEDYPIYLLEKPLLVINIKKNISAI